MVSVGHIRRRAGKYLAVFRVDGVQHSKTFRRLADAQAYLREVDAQILRDEWVSPDDRRTTVVTYAERWAAAQPWRPSTRARVASVLNQQVLPAFGERRLGSIRRSEIQAWIAAMSQALAPATVEGAYRLLASILRAAQHDRLIGQSPAEGVRLARRDGVMVPPLSVVEVEALAAAIVPELRAAVLVAAMTGLRQGELFGLTEDRVKWLERSLVVDRQLVTRPGVVEFGPTKTARSARTVPVNDRVLELLSEQIREFGRGEDGLVFHRAGGPWRRQAASRAMRSAGGQGWHALRHHCASVLIFGGAPVTAVAAMLGHSPEECLRTYASWWPAEDEVLRTAVSGAWGLRSGIALPR